LIRFYRGVAAVAIEQEEDFWIGRLDMLSV